MNPLTEPENFQQWKDSPLTQAFLAYLKDRRAYLMEQWGRGQPMPPELQAQAVVLHRISNLTSEEVQEQYESQQELKDGQG